MHVRVERINECGEGVVARTLCVATHMLRIRITRRLCATLSPTRDTNTRRRTFPRS